MQYEHFYSDPHFGHTNIIKYCNRPFEDAEHMTEELIRRYNDRVDPRDAVLWLGDCFFSAASAGKILPRLNGYKWLLRGNHDKRVTDAQFLKAGFQEVFPRYFASDIGGLPVYFSHYPFEGYSEDKRYPDRRPPMDLDRVIVHGHTHEKARLTRKGTVHVGVDAWDYGPAPYDEVFDLVRRALG